MSEAVDTAQHNLAPAAEYRPYEAGPFRMAMNLQAIDAADWLEIAGDYPAQMAERHRLLREQPQAVLACLPEAQAAAHELLEVLVDHLVTRHAQWFERHGDVLHNRLLDQQIDVSTLADPLAVAGQLVQEDFCLNQLHPDGHHLTAAVLCFPSRWKLSDKLGKPLLGVHEHVPFYAERLGNPVERFFGSLKVGKLAQRVNWSVLDDPTLFQLSGHGDGGVVEDLTAENALGRIYLRVERQTFRRLPRSNAVVFGIRTYVTPMHRIAGNAAEAARLTAALQALPPEMARYKSLERCSAALLQALASVLP